MALKKQKNCAVLEGRFGWEAAARAVHQVCRRGRDAKKAYGEEMFGHRAGRGDAESPPKREETFSLKQGVAGSFVGNPRRPQANRGKQAPRRVAGNGHDDEGGRKRPQGDEARKDEEEEAQEIQPEQPEQSNEADGEEKPIELSKEAAFLKAAEDTEGGQGTMLFPEFVEAITRICLARYGPRAAPRHQGSAAPNVAKTGKGAANGGAGWRKANFGSGLKFRAKPFARGRNTSVRGVTVDVCKERFIEACLYGSKGSTSKLCDGL